MHKIMKKILLMPKYMVVNQNNKCGYNECNECLKLKITIFFFCSSQKRTNIGLGTIQ